MKTIWKYFLLLLQKSIQIFFNPAELLGISYYALITPFTDK